MAGHATMYDHQSQTPPRQGWRNENGKEKSAESARVRKQRSRSLGRECRSDPDGNLGTGLGWAKRKRKHGNQMPFHGPQSAPITDPMVRGLNMAYEGHAEQVNTV